MTTSHILTPELLDDVRQAVLDGRTAMVASLNISGVTLGAAAECACWWSAHPPAAGEERQLRDQWRATLPVIGEIQQHLEARDGRREQQDRFGAPTREFRRIDSGADLESDEWELFVGRFSRALRQNGFSSVLARAVGKAFHEMADNLAQHSGPATGAPAPGIVGYQAGERWFSFAVVDTGRGVLDSLRQNPRNAGLTNSKRALFAAVREHATRKPDEEYGDGFRQMHRWLADLNGTLRFRSGDGVLTLRGRGEDRLADTLSSAPLRGFQVCVCCGLDAAPPAYPV